MKKGLKASLVLLAIAAITNPMAVKVNAANNYIPELQIRQQGSTPRIEIGVDIADEDVVYTNNLRGNYTLKCGSANSVGNQSVTNGVYSIHDTVTNRQGNEWWSHYGQIDSTVSRLCLDNKAYPDNGQWMSLVVHARGEGNSYLESVMEAAESTYKGFIIHDKLTFAEDVDFTSMPKSFKVNVPPEWKGQNIALNVVSYKGVNHNTGSSNISGVLDTNTGVFHCNAYHSLNSSSSLRSKFYCGDKVLGYSWANTNIGRNLRDDNQWHYISYNQKLIDDKTLYDFKVDGMHMYFRVQTDSSISIDSIKLGKASRVQIMRNGSTLVYDGYASDVTDSNLIVKPNKPTITNQVTLADGIRFDYNAATNREIYKYSARSCSSNGNWSNWSQEYPVTLTSTPTKYHIKVYKNGALIADEDTGISWSYGDVKRGDKITGQIYTIDTQGQTSPVTDINYIVGQTANDLKADYNDFANKLNVSNTTDINSVKSQISALRTNTNIPYNITKMDKSNATKYVKGKVEAITTVNGQYQTLSTPIKCKPEYQTEQELKEDITDYIGQTQIHSSDKKIPDILSYAESKDIDGLTKDIISKCKTNPDLKDVEIEFNNSATEFKSGELQGKIYLKD